MSAALRLGTRRSALATTQAQWVAEQLRAAGHQVTLVGITTDGDRLDDAAGTDPVGSGVFVSALRTALDRGEIDLAVHSLKDLPVAGTTPDTLASPRPDAPASAPRPDAATSAPGPAGHASGTVVAAVPRREDPRDVLVARDGMTLGELPAGARIGTGSPRRIAQLAALGLGLNTHPVRGNVDTRLALVADGRLDAVVLARAGLARLGRLEEVTETLDPIMVLPAPGQGALAVECRADAVDLQALLGALDDAETRACVVAERAVLAGLQAGCSAPVGALAEVVEGDHGLELSLRAVVAAPDGSDALRRSVLGPITDPADLGHRLAALLLADGAAEIAPLAGPSAPPAHPGASAPAYPGAPPAPTDPGAPHLDSIRHHPAHGTPHAGIPASANLPEATP